MCEMPVILGRAIGLSGICGATVRVKAASEAATMNLNCIWHLECVVAQR
jgi:hypothetical protein